MDATVTGTSFSRNAPCNAVARRGRPTNDSVAALELVARGQEAHLFSAAVRTVVGRLEAVLLQPHVEIPPDALMFTLQLRSMADRYARRWEPEP